MKTKTFTYVLLSMILLWTLTGFCQDTGNSSITPESVLPRDGIPPYEFVPFMEMYAFDHPGFGTYLAALGDVNQDGYDDFAVSTSLDTTFIFYGGPDLDDKADLFVLGGGYGILAGDVNGDGLTDIVTSWYTFPRQNPDYRGKVEVYLHTGGDPPYRPVSDVVYLGHKNSVLGSYLWGLDINCDKKMDLVVFSSEPSPTGYGFPYLYLGSSTPDTIPDYIFYDTFKQENGDKRREFGRKALTGDINGDGCDDLILSGYGRDTTIHRDFYNWEVHLGHPTDYGKIYTQITHYQNHGWLFDLVDMNGDGCLDYHFPGEQPEPILAWGSCGLEFPEQDFLPDTTFPNSWPRYLAYATAITQVGDLDNSGYDDYFITWDVKDPSTGTIVGSTIFFYRGGPGLRTSSPAFFPYGGPNAPRSTHVSLGDITGDGIDDFGRYYGWFNPDDIQYASSVWLYKGDNRLQVVSVPSEREGENHIEEDIRIYPNPAIRFYTPKLEVESFIRRAGPVRLRVFSLMGREIHSEKRQIYKPGPVRFTLPLNDYPAGMYRVFLQSGLAIRAKSFLLVK